MLTPVLDSLAYFYESALGRPIRLGTARGRSADEALLIRLIEGTASRACLDCGERAVTALECALCSTRIMITLTMGTPARPAQ